MARRARIDVAAATEKWAAYAAALRVDSDAVPSWVADLASRALAGHHARLTQSARGGALVPDLVALPNAAAKWPGWPRPMTAAERAGPRAPVDDPAIEFSDVLAEYPRFWPLSAILTHWNADDVAVPADEEQVHIWYLVFGIWYLR